MAGRRGSRRVVLAVAGLLVVLGAGWAFACARTLRAAATGVERGRAVLVQVSDRAEPEDVLSGAHINKLTRASTEFDRAARLLNRPHLQLLRPLPVAGRNLGTARSLAATGARLSKRLAEVEGVLTAQRELARTDPTARPGAVRAIAEQLSGLRGELVAADLGAADGLVGRLAKARLEIDRRRLEALTAIDRIEPTLRAAADILAGPRTYLVLAANNAEMRAGSGTVLAAAEVRIEQGKVTSRGFVRAGQVVPQPGSKPLPNDPDVAARFAFLTKTDNLQSLFLSSRMEVVGPRAAALWEASGRSRVDGVVVLDVPGLGALLTATGPLDLAGRSLTARSLETLLLHDQYVSSPDDSAERYQTQAAVAEAIFVRLSAGGLDVAKLASAVQDAVAGRHLLAWSSNEAEQAAWERGGADGRLGPRSVSVGVLNLGTNKLDPRLAVQATLGVAPRTAPTPQTGLSLTVRLENKADPRDPTYINGPNQVRTEPGEYVGILVVEVPRWWSGLAVEGSANVPALGDDGPLSTLVAVRIRLSRGETTAITFRATAGGVHGALQLEPSARRPGVAWTGPAGPLKGDDGHVVRW